LFSLKKSEFENENEFRVYSSSLQSDFCQKIFDPKTNKRRLRFIFDRKTISEIWVGPNLDFEVEKIKIEKLLISSGYDLNHVKILKSRHLE